MQLSALVRGVSRSTRAVPAGRVGGGASVPERVILMYIRKCMIGVSLDNNKLAAFRAKGRRDSRVERRFAPNLPGQRSFHGSGNALGVLIKNALKMVATSLESHPNWCDSSENEWRAIANHFGERWNFHHVIGAMDGKHCVIDPPLKSGSMYYNYKGDYSVVLLALVDADLRFIYVDVGANGRVSDSGVQNSQVCDNNNKRRSTGPYVKVLRSDMATSIRLRATHCRVICAECGVLA
ncbi:hypothetical protein ALC62_08828 [Cyphomyrmex costatus]|uniref:DDE Tnp4 domain-containing protein n=1 Tax=Cyphomyrmex costatus TaxID=456900 RepID=A0A195CIS2_9HYME|nr:hypothetical protein ALC62_08828 [Cyphomyrmex costatus]